MHPDVRRRGRRSRSGPIAPLDAGPRHAASSCTATSRKSSRARNSGASSTPSPKPGPTSPASGRRPPVTATGGSCNGSKIWSTGAHQADYAMCLARTDWDVPEAPRPHLVRGADRMPPGVTVRPIRQINGGVRVLRGVPRRRGRQRRRHHRRGEPGLVGRPDDAGVRAGRRRVRRAARGAPELAPDLVELARTAGRLDDPSPGRPSPGPTSTTSPSTTWAAGSPPGCSAPTTPQPAVAAYGKLAAGTLSPIRARLGRRDRRRAGAPLAAGRRGGGHDCGHQLPQRPHGLHRRRNQRGAAQRYRRAGARPAARAHLRFHQAVPRGRARGGNWNGNVGWARARLVGAADWVGASGWASRDPAAVAPMTTTSHVSSRGSAVTSTAPYPSDGPLLARVEHHRGAAGSIDVAPTAWAPPRAKSAIGGSNGLRYGMNPHQQPATAASVARLETRSASCTAQPSYINVLDALGAWALVRRSGISAGNDVRRPRSSTSRRPAQRSPDRLTRSWPRRMDSTRPPWRGDERLRPGA